MLSCKIFLSIIIVISISLLCYACHSVYFFQFCCAVIWSMRRYSELPLLAKKRKNQTVTKVNTFKSGSRDKDYCVLIRPLSNDFTLHHIDLSYTSCTSRSALGFLKNFNDRNRSIMLLKCSLERSFTDTQKIRLVRFGSSIQAAFKSKKPLDFS